MKPGSSTGAAAMRDSPSSIKARTYAAAPCLSPERQPASQCKKGLIHETGPDETSRLDDSNAPDDLRRLRAPENSTLNPRNTPSRIIVAASRARLGMQVVQASIIYLRRRVPREQPER